MAQIWYGTQESYDLLADAKLKVSAMLKSSPKMAEYEMPSLLEMEGDVGVVNIKGSLINGSAGFMRLFGVTGYDDIAEALLEAVKDSKVKSIMLSVASPGGSAKGVKPLGEFLKNVGQVKPVNVHAEDIGSAAYWLGSAGGHITLDEMGMAGSIGALVVHTDETKALDQMGIKKTVIRAGVNKALANPYEVLSDEARAGLQEMVDDARDMIVNQVADNRGVTSATVQSQMGQGKEFMGAKALAVGLVDRIGTFQDALAYSKESRTGFKAVKAIKV